MCCAAAVAPPQAAVEMTAFLSVHPKQPQLRLVRQAAKALQDGGVVAYPTDSYYALGCLPGNAAAMERIRRLRGLEAEHQFTLLCGDIKQIDNYAPLDNAVFRLIKSHVPGPYTFVLGVGKKTARHLRRSKATLAFRIPSHPVALALLEESGGAILSTTLQLAGEAEPLGHEYLREHLRNLVDVVVESGPCCMTQTTVLDFTHMPPRLLREGGGAVEKGE